MEFSSDRSTGSNEGVVFVTRSVSFCLLGIVVWGAVYSRFALGPLQEIIRLQLHLSDNELSWLQGPALAIPMALVSIPIAILGFSFNPTLLLLLCSSLIFIASTLTPFASNFVTLCITRSVIGASVSGVLVVGYTLVSKITLPGQRGRGNMLMMIGELAGAPAAFAVGGYLIERVVNYSFLELEGWRLASLCMCIPLAVAMCAALYLKGDRATLPYQNDISSRPPTWKQCWESKSLLGSLLVARIMVWIADGATFVWAPATFARRFSLTPLQVGSIMSVCLASSAILGTSIGGILSDYCQRSGGPNVTRRMLLLVATLSAPCACFPLSGSWIVSACIMTAFLTLGYVFGIGALTLGTIEAPSSVRGVYIAVTVTLGAAFCLGVAPLAVSSISVMLGGPSSIGDALAIVCVSGSVLSIFTFSRRAAES